jgi:hypothetical protein
MDQLLANRYTPERPTFPRSRSSSYRPCSSVYSNDNNFSLEDLVRRIDTSIKATEVNTTGRLMEENELLREHVAYYRRIWGDIMEFLCEVMELSVLLEGSLEEARSRMASAEGDWLASWGIGRGLETGVWF